MGVVDDTFPGCAIQDTTMSTLFQTVLTQVCSPKAKNVVRRAALFCSNPVIDAHRLMMEPSLSALNSGMNQVAGNVITPYKEAKECCLDSLTRQYHNLLKKSSGNAFSDKLLAALIRGF